ncbi:hypothetical protein D3C76_1568060 [compost metagenome]
MAIFGMVVVMRTIKISRHYTSIVASMLAIEAFTQLYSSNFGDSVRFVCWLEQSGK